jgi:tetratricopeptide (TPR) repeat protein
MMGDDSVTIGALRDLHQLMGEARLDEGLIGDASLLFQRAASHSAILIEADAIDVDDIIAHFRIIRHLGDIALRQGLWDLAAQKYHSKFDLEIEVRSELSGRIEYILEHRLTLLLLGDVERFAGDFAESAGYYSKCLDLLDEFFDSQSSEDKEFFYGDAYGIVFEKLAEISLLRGKLEDARRYALDAHRLVADKLLVLGGTPEGLRDYGYTLGVIGQIELMRNEYGEAEDIFTRKIRIDRQLIDDLGPSPRAIRDLCLSQGGIGDVYLMTGRIDEARDCFEEKRSLEDGLLRDFGPDDEVSRELHCSLQRIGDILASKGLVDAARDHFLQACARLLDVSSRLFTWPQDADQCALRLKLMLEMGRVSIDQGFALRHELWVRLHEYLDLQSVEVLERESYGVTRFHALWLRVALEHAPQRIPEVLGAVGGRKVAALVLEELEQQQVAEPGDADDTDGVALRQRYLALRAELRRQALGLRVFAGRQRGGDSGGHDPKNLRAMEGPRPSLEAAPAINREVYRSKEAEYQAILAEYRRVRAELASEPGFEALAVPLMYTGDLQAGLDTDQALLILVQPPVDPGQETSDTAHALLLTRSSHHYQPLPGLLQSVISRRALGQQQATQPGNRYAATRDAGAARIDGDRPPQEPTAFERIPGLQHTLWQPLAPHLQGIRRVDVVTHGELHLLALQDEAPQNLRVHHFPGIVFRWLAQQRNDDTAAKRAAELGHETIVVLHTYSPAQGEALPPIPFVSAEAEALQQLWPRPAPLVLDRETYADVLHVAGHGTPGQGEDAGVLIGPGHTFGLHELLGSRLRGQIAFLNACTVGQVSEDLDGDPVATLTGLFLRGYREIVAPLVPVNDFFSGIFAALLHAALQAQDPVRLDAHQALQQAKAQLRGEIDWPEQACQAIEQAYTPVMQRAIEGVLKGGGDVHNDLPKLLVQWLSPMYSYSFLMADEEGPFEKVMHGDGAEAGARAAAQLLVARRDRVHQHPAVQTLLRHVSVFGAPTR